MKVYPEMVTRGEDGKALSVRYQLLAPLLPNELQKQAAQNQSLEQRIAALEASMPAAPKPARLIEHIRRNKRKAQPLYLQ